MEVHYLVLKDSLFEGVLLFYAHFTDKQMGAREDKGSTANQERAPKSGTAL